jgi:ABC-type antimicrobial peptide transport system permease subunit
MGVRLALGARPREVVTLVLRQGLRLGIPGVALGIAGALAVTRFLEGMLYGVSPTDPITFLLLAALMLAVTTLGAWIPARRIVARDPLRALREE